MEEAGYYFEGRGENTFSDGGVGVKRDITQQAVGVISSWGVGWIGGGLGGVVVGIITVNGKVMCAWITCISCKKKKKGFPPQEKKQQTEPVTAHLSPPSPTGGLWPLGDPRGGPAAIWLPPKVSLG